LVFDIDKVDIENNENENFPIINLTDESEKINEEQVNDEEKFDPIFSDEEKIKEIPVVEKYSISEDVEEKIPVVEFKKDSPAEQANEITNVVKTEKIEKEPEEEKSDLMKKF
jgi:adenylate kinase